MLSGCRFLGMTLEERNPGLVITKIANGGPADRAGLRVGDRLIAANNKPLTKANSREFKQIMADARSSCRLSILISRGGGYKRFDARLEPYSNAQIEKIIAAHLSQSHPSTAGVH